MQPLELGQGAAVYRFALLGGIVKTPEVIAWADAWIWRLEHYPDALVEVSLNGSRPNELLAALGELAEQPLSPEALVMLFSLMSDHLSERQLGFRTVTQLLAHMSIEGALPTALAAEAYRLDDSLCLAEGGIFDLAEVEQEISTFLEQYAG